MNNNTAYLQTHAGFFSFLLFHESLSLQFIQSFLMRLIVTNLLASFFHRFDYYFSIIIYDNMTKKYITDPLHNIQIVI